MIIGQLIKSFGFASLLLLGVSSSYAQQQRVVIPESVIEHAYQQVSPLDVGSYDDFVRQFVIMASDNIDAEDQHWLNQQLRQPTEIGVQQKFHAILTAYAKSHEIAPNNWDLPFFDKGFLQRMLGDNNSVLYRTNLAEQFAGSENIVVASMRSELEQRFIYITLKDVADMLQHRDLEGVFANIQEWLENISLENQVIRNQNLSRAQLLAVRQLIERTHGSAAIAAN